MVAKVGCPLMSTDWLSPDVHCCIRMRAAFAHSISDRCITKRVRVGLHSVQLKPQDLEGGPPCQTTLFWRRAALHVMLCFSVLHWSLCGRSTARSQPLPTEGSLETLNENGGSCSQITWQLL